MDANSGAITKWLYRDPARPVEKMTQGEGVPLSGREVILKTPVTEEQIRALKEQVAALKAEMLAQTSQIRSEVEYLARDRGPGSGFAPGGFCGGDPCKEDSDGDGLGDCEDVCPCEPSTACSGGR